MAGPDHLNRRRQNRFVSRVLSIGLDGASYGNLIPMAELGVMPHLAELLQSSALVRTHNGDSASPVASWSGLRTGCGPETHEVLDDSYLDHRRQMILPAAPRPLPCPTLVDTLIAADPYGVAVSMLEGQGCHCLRRRNPVRSDEWMQQIARIQESLQQYLGRVYQADAGSDWRLMELRIDVLDAWQQRLGYVTGTGGSPGGVWEAPAREMLRIIDRGLGELMALAERRRAAVVLASPFGSCPLREEFNLYELLRRQRLLYGVAPLRAACCRATHMAGKALRWTGRWGTQQSLLPPDGRLVPGLLPIDWRRSLAVALHGEMSALVYLNTPERFGTRAVVTPRQREQATIELLAALAEARHPASQEPLFSHVYATAERYRSDPLTRLWPEVVATVAPGFQVGRQPDGRGPLLKSPPTPMATRQGEGLLMIRAPGVVVGRPYQASLVDVAPTILDLLDLKPPATMTGRVLTEIFRDAPAEIRG
jgi:predicted AlkP superfamily phosphohydrolase/phosphomutase